MTVPRSRGPEVGLLAAQLPALPPSGSVLSLPCLKLSVSEARCAVTMVSRDLRFILKIVNNFLGTFSVNYILK